ncbi:hypothetical protein WMF37_28900 [Sorangium sp. So ce291]|uniref:hypothetical protein n=1 Tax=Sorangium sp. So ce291 TaxID=3133294 RepID=UPI003F6017D5
MTMSNYYVDFNNNTLQTWTMGVYQVLPDSPGLDSVSWKQSTAPTQGSTGVSWSISYNAALADYQQAGGIGVYKASQVLAAELGTSWDIVFEDNVQQLIKSGTTTAGQILINNRSNRLANPGIGMDGQGSVYKNGVASGASGQFVVTPTYWAGLFNQVELGEVISSNVIVGPFEVTYPSGMNVATLDARMDGESIVVDISYSSRTMHSRAALKHRTSAMRALRAAT